MKTPAYILRARREFLEGTGHTVPEEAIQAGFRTPGEWCEMLERHRTAPRGNSKDHERAKGATERTHDHAENFDSID
jgi:hypothetical protein